jgi:hypothetical protein
VFEIQRLFFKAGIFDRAPPPYFSLIYRRLEDHDHCTKAMGGSASQNTAVTRSAHTGPDLPEAWRCFHGQKAAYSGFTINGSVSKQQGRASMSENTACDASVSGPTAVESLKMLLDYAIAEGGELRLPVFVLLLRMANLELAKSSRRQPRLNSDSPSLRGADERVAP